jgi:acyl-CoA reductase-like NAD-dependent aldehyde dehydrogenase
VKALKVGDPREEDIDIGPMIDRQVAAEALKKINEAVTSGAKVLLGGTCQDALFQPTIITDTTSEMRVRQEEMFAPVITITSYDRFEEALDITNQTAFGLQHGVFTKDMGRIMTAYEEIQSGGVIINDVSTFRLDHMPYGGLKDSGIGKEGPRYVIEEMTIPKLMILNMS